MFVWSHWMEYIQMGKDGIMYNGMGLYGIGLSNYFGIRWDKKVRMGP